ncbi:MAG: HAMP domain-containing sensor histidine kinase [Myxococcota bacterium]|nr:HAMP domain-containing sensor histidine kinase [Myxococcota bacterium]
MKRSAESLNELDPALMSPEEAALAEAHRAADEKVALWRRIARLAIIAVPLLIFIPLAGALVAFFGGIPLARRAYRIYYEPRLRARFIDEEVAKRVNSSVRIERETLEGEHARSLERLSASIAHEIRNPITAAKSLVQQMGEDPVSGENVEYARVALEELGRVERSIAHLLRYAREEAMRPELTPLTDVFDSAIETFRDRAIRERVEITKQYDSEAIVEGDPEKLRRVAINLLNNAMDALAEESVGHPCIRVSMGENLAGTEVWVRVVDNGPGMEIEDRAQIFEPFYTSKPDGTGLGLPITRKLVEAHRGSIEISDPEPGEKGTTFVLTFPKAAAVSGSRRSSSEGEARL